MARVESYRQPDGSFTTSKSGAIRCDAGDVVIAWRSQTSRIPATFAVGTAQHETNFAVNERDEENDERSTVTDGIFQLERSECVKAGYPEVDPFDIVDASIVFAILMERNFQKLVDAAGMTDAEFIARGGLGYLAWSHNTGLAHKDGKTNALESIQRDGVDWEAWCSRNTGYDWGVKMAAYGRDCISGGPLWRPEFEPGIPPADGGGDSPTSSPYDVEPTISAINKSRLRLLFVGALLLLIFARLMGRGRIAPSI